MAFPLLDDDAEALAAALSFVDDYSDLLAELKDAAAAHAAPDSSPSPSSSGSEGHATLVRPLLSAAASASAPRQSPASPSVGARKEAKNHRNGAREERLRELRRLRLTAVELEQELQALQLTNRQRQRRTGHGGRREELQRVHAAGRSSAALVWKQLAARQLEQRLASENENRRLRIIVERQRKVTKTLEKVLQSRATKETLDACKSGKRTRRVHAIVPDRSDPAIFQELLAQVELAYAEVDQVFQSSGQHRGTHGTYLGIFADKVLPFDVTDTGAAVWQFLAHSADQSEYRFYFQRDSETFGVTPEDVVVERFGVELQAEDVSGDFTIRQIFRRYIESDRIVIVWRSYIDPVEFRKAPLSGARFSEKGYIVIKRPTTLPDFALLQTWYIVTPDTPADMFPELTEFVLNGSATARAVQVIENILLQRAMTK